MPVTCSSCDRDGQGSLCSHMISFAHPVCSKGLLHELIKIPKCMGNLYVGHLLYLLFSILFAHCDHLKLLLSPPYCALLHTTSTTLSENGQSTTIFTVLIKGNMCVQYSLVYSDFS